MSDRSDFLIAGAGAIGLTSALSLLEAGYRVTVAERGEVGQEASWAGGGIMSPLCPWDYQEAVNRLALRGMGMLGDAAALLHATTGIDPEYQRCGMLLLPPYRKDVAVQWCEQHRFPMQLVELADYLPKQYGEGLLLPEVAQVRNPRLLRALRHRVEMLGGTILEHCEVKKIELMEGRVAALQTSRGRLEAGGYVVTAGAWSKVLLGEYALNLDIRPIRGQMLLFKFDAPPFRQILFRDGLYFIPRRDGHLLVGSTLEDAGFDKSVTTEAFDDMMRQVREIFPDWQAEPIRQWAGFRPGSPDNVPTIGRHPQLENLYANTGHFRYGVTMSLASAELLRNEIEGEPQPFDTSVYRWR
ncbi:putative D-amino acid oxidase [Ferrigenium kumadai]|uniref:D-amino acid oxidase n=1 Tax=Ferrigenium kumadai TaxID=1682490 RepID=A0AAN1VZC7_9PROT|nr:glycine oxidase ThiO [Ferrigenium kumadai]BBI99185.1 putative D-amino acid oxidase [Ferrigenium kumadai]